MKKTLTMEVECCDWCGEQGPGLKCQVCDRSLCSGCIKHLGGGIIVCRNCNNADEVRAIVKEFADKCDAAKAECAKQIDALRKVATGEKSP